MSLTVWLVTHVCLCNRNVRYVVHADIWISVSIGKPRYSYKE